MIEKVHLSVILIIAAGLWGAMLLLEGLSVTPAYFHPFSRVLGVVMLLLSAFEQWLWKWSLLRGWLVKRPVLCGTWRAELRSNWIDPKTGSKIPPIIAFVVVRQTFSRVSISLFTAESQSELLGAEISRSGNGSYKVFGVYQNEPRMSVRHRSEIHYGGLILQVSGATPSRIDGHYWTDRQTAGEIELTDRRSVYITDFQSAGPIFSNVTP